MDLFLYGRLLHTPLFATLAGAEAGVWQPADLADHAIETATGDALSGPVLVARPGAVARGMLVSQLSQSQRNRLARIEVPVRHRDEMIEVQLSDGSLRPAQVWLFPQLRGTGQPWSLEAWAQEFGPLACGIAAELVAHDPPLTAEDYRRQSGMIRGRAATGLRAARAAAPATLRHDARPGDSDWRDSAPLAGDFFKMARMRMAHRRFDGSRATGLAREVLIGADAALVLPYDPARDRVLLVEQFRTGPARRGDRNPWCLEPVAGIVDPGETPAEAARRETGEEAGITLDDLRPMFSGYASPGSTTDHFYCFLGLADLPETESWTGGLAEESEDLRLHVLGLDAALDLVDSGEITVTPLIAMLYWLARHRARLRAEAGAGDA